MFLKFSEGKCSFIKVIGWFDCLEVGIIKIIWWSRNLEECVVGIDFFGKIECSDLKYSSIKWGRV